MIELVQEANRRVHQRAIDDASASGMGTTMTVALFDEEDGSVTIGHVGDSRAYILRDGAARAAHRRPLARRRARPPRRAVAGRGRGASAALGDHARARHRPRRRRRRVHGPGAPGRRLPALLRRPDDDGRRRRGSPTLVLRNRHDLRQATHALITAANDHGGDDNVTAVLFEVAEAGATATRARRRRSSSPDPDEADTLHPEDRVALPPLDEPPARSRRRPTTTTASESRRPPRRHDDRLRRRRSHGRPAAEARPRRRPSPTTEP